MFDEVLKILKDTLNDAFSRNTEKQRTRKIIFWADKYIIFKNKWRN